LWTATGDDVDTGAVRIERAVSCKSAHCVDPVSGRCVNCLAQVHPSFDERITKLEESNKKLAEQVLALTERIAKLEAASRRTLL
jgi:hypothetical protein